jgi:hypothetical protein
MDATGNEPYLAAKLFLLPVAGGREAPAGVEAVIKPVPVQIPPLAVLVQIRDVAVAIRVNHDYTKSRPRHHPSNILRIVSYLESKIL